ncbi:MAG: hypothetical protein PHF29_03725, partial [Candidatus Riflebacteria bacterium]|nr:hypothetical protein [Candidatus Riflebacteria bacterium]
MFIKKLLCCVSIFVFVLGIAVAGDLADSYPGNALMFARVNIQDYINSYIADSKGNEKNILDQVISALKKNHGINVSNDIKSFGMFMFDSLEPSSYGVPGFNLVFFVEGNFEPEKHISVIAKIIEGKEGTPVKSGNINYNNSKVPAIKWKDGLFFFKDNNTLIHCKNNTSKYLLNNKITFGKAPADVARVINENRSFVCFSDNFWTNSTVSKNFAKVPAPVQGFLSNLRILAGKYDEGFLSLWITFANPEGANGTFTLLDQLRAKFNNDSDQAISKFTANIDKLSANELVSEGSQVMSLARMKDLIAEINLSVQEEKTLFIKGPVLDSHLILAGIGLSAAIAIPNFQAARGQARQKACFANQRVLMGAIEMYNMDHDEMIKEITPDIFNAGGLLLREKYLANPLRMPDPDCLIYSEG